MNGPAPEIVPDPTIPLPPYELRMGGRHFKKDPAFVNAGVRDVRQLRQRAGLGRRKRVLDWGCGAGRLAVGIKHLLGHVEDYHGVDVQPALIGWAQAHLADEHHRFTLVDAHNARYNPRGRPSFDIPADDGSVDVVHGYSVFSHMLADDVAGYAATIRRILAPEGRAWLTAFVEEEVPDCVENPDDYLDLRWDGALHCVRYERHFFEQLMWDAGLAVSEFVHGKETDGQSVYVLRRR
ncbi:class I SAM-dependent methyltransferase [Nocardioides sp. C4-1]|uniref:class I SAM-dependent methyltransferase n=1 Tax=Nocardioides sp. C4-1 TaxID=3151851 RepID=UPI0032666F05